MSVLTHPDIHSYISQRRQRHIIVAFVLLWEQDRRIEKLMQSKSPLRMAGYLFSVRSQLHRGQMQVTEVQMKAKIALVLLVHAFVIWFGCGLTVAVGRGVLGLDTTLWLHAIIAPTLAVFVSLVYFNRFHASPPLVVATFFVSFIIIMDATVVALVFEKSYAMFGSILGTWLPFLLIFVATYLTGILVRERTRPIQRAARTE